MEISKFLLSFLFMGVTTSIVSIGIKTANTFKIFKSIGVGFNTENQPSF